MMIFLLLLFLLLTMFLLLLLGSDSSVMHFAPVHSRIYWLCTEEQRCSTSTWWGPWLPSFSRSSRQLCLRRIQVRLIGRRNLLCVCLAHACCVCWFCREETEKIVLNPERSDKHPFLGLAFKLEVNLFPVLASHSTVFFTLTCRLCFCSAR